MKIKPEFMLHQIGEEYIVMVSATKILTPTP